MAVNDMIIWLRAQLDDDERVARAATAGPWRYDPTKHWRKPGTVWFQEAVFTGPAGADATCVTITGETDDPQSMADAEHIARWDPARVLAEIETDRRILDLHKHYPASISGGFGCGICAINPNGNYEEPDGWCLTVRALALPYADRPGFREEWACTA